MISQLTSQLINTISLLFLDKKIKTKLDYVRLQAGLAPPHWRRRTQQQPEKRRWDEGYEKTGYFLEWLERTDVEESVGRAVVRPLNLKLANTEYNDSLFEFVTGHSIAELWKQYERWLDAGGDRKI